MSPDGPGQTHVEVPSRASRSSGLGEGSGRCMPDTKLHTLDHRRVDRDVHVHMLLEGRTVQRDMHS